MRGPTLDCKGAFRALVACLAFIGFACAVQAYQQKHGGANTASSDLQASFETVYSSHHWGQEGGGSGTGSTVEVTSITRSILRSVVSKFELRSLMDAPCGAMVWMPAALQELKEDFPAFRYLGVDIVRPVIQENQEKFSDNSQWMQFRVVDFSKEMQQDHYDLIFCRDALQHLPFSVIINALETFSQSSARYLLVGSYLGIGQSNMNLNGSKALVDGPGGGFNINLVIEPFNLPGYQHVYNEHTSQLIEAPDKFLLLYPISYLRSINFGEMRDRAANFAP